MQSMMRGSIHDDVQLIGFAHDDRPLDFMPAS